MVVAVLGKVAELTRRLWGLAHENHGPIAHERVAEALSQVDALVVPSLWRENSPLVIHEAMLAGLPVVASRVGGIPELVRDGDTGFLYKASDPAELAGDYRTERAVEPSPTTAEAKP